MGTGQSVRQRVGRSRSYFSEESSQTWTRVPHAAASRSPFLLKVKAQVAPGGPPRFTRMVHIEALVIETTTSAPSGGAVSAGRSIAAKRSAAMSSTTSRPVEREKG